MLPIDKDFYFIGSRLKMPAFFECSARFDLDEAPIPSARSHQKNILLVHTQNQSKNKAAPEKILFYFSSLC